MPRVHAGAVLDRAPGPKYLKALSFAELRIDGPAPKTATLAGWRESIPAEFALGLVTPNEALRSDLGPLRSDEAMELAIEWAIEAAEALDVRFLIVPTGGDLSTGQRARDRLAAWLEPWSALRAKGLTVVWHPSGLWDAEIADPFARKLGVVRAFDPLSSEEPPAGLAYGRMRTLGRRSRFTETLLLEAVDAVRDHERAYLSIDSPRSFAEASRLAILAAELED